MTQTNKRGALQSGAPRFRWGEFFAIEEEESLDQGEIIRLRDGREVLLRPIQWGDERALCRFYDRLSRESRAWFRPDEFNFDTARAVILQAQRRQGVWLVAVTQTPLFRRKRIVAYGWCTRLRGDAIPYLGLAVADNHQGQGLGRTILKRLMEHARRNGEKEIQLNVYKDNLRAIRLYEAEGFVMDGETDDRKQFRMRRRLE